MNRQKIIEKIAYYLYEERQKNKLDGTREEDIYLAEIELMNYEFFKEEYKYIENIIKEIIK